MVGCSMFLVMLLSKDQMSNVMGSCPGYLIPKEEITSWHTQTPVVNFLVGENLI